MATKGDLKILESPGFFRKHTEEKEFSKYKHTFQSTGSIRSHRGWYQRVYYLPSHLPAAKRQRWLG